MTLINAAMDNPNNEWQWYVANVKNSPNARGGPRTNYDIVTTLPRELLLKKLWQKKVFGGSRELEEGEQVWLHSKSQGNVRRLSRQTISN